MCSTSKSRSNGFMLSVEVVRSEQRIMCERCEALEHELESLRNEYDMLVLSYDDLRTEYELLRDEYRDVERERDEYRRDYESVVRERDEYESSLVALQQDYDECQRRCMVLEADVSQADTDYIELERFVLDLFAELERAASELDATEFRERALELARRFAARIVVETLHSENS